MDFDARLDLIPGDAPATSPPGTGLASLDFTLPERGREYVFTTTGGRLELRGRHASRRLLWGLGHIAAVLAVLGLGWLLVRAVGRGRFRRLGQPAVLAVISLLALFVGIFPILAVIGLITAIVLALRRLASRSRATVAMEGAPLATETRGRRFAKSGRMTSSASS